MEQRLIENTTSRHDNHFQAILWISLSVLFVIILCRTKPNANPNFSQKEICAVQKGDIIFTNDGIFLVHQNLCDRSVDNEIFVISVINSKQYAAHLAEKTERIIPVDNEEHGNSLQFFLHGGAPEKKEVPKIP